MTEAFNVDVPAPRGEHSDHPAVSCRCCVDARADLLDASRVVMDAWMLGGDYWRELTSQQPPHPVMRRLLDSYATVENRHHRGETWAGWGTTGARDAAPEFAAHEGLFAPPQGRADR